MPSNNKIKIGEKFGELIILELGGLHQEPSGHKRQLVKVQCSCGNVYETVYSYIKRKNGTRSCKNCMGHTKRMCKVGEKYDKLIVVGYDTIDKRTIVTCDCECGTKNIKIRANVLKRNLTNNCGCAPRGRWNGVGELSNTFFYRIKRNALLRGIDFNLTIKDLWELYETQNYKCALSGLPIEFNLKTYGKNTASLDRIDNSKGYTIDNIWWVHKDINIMKMDHKLEYFLELCKKVTIKNGL